MNATGGDTQWRDLSTNRAGQAPQKAVELKEEAPVKTILARILAPHARNATGVSVPMEKKGRMASAEAWPGVARHPSVPVGDKGSDIDHVGDRATRVFTVNTRTTAGRTCGSTTGPRAGERAKTVYPGLRYEARRATVSTRRRAGSPSMCTR